MVADVEVPGGPGGGPGRELAANHELDAEHLIGVADDALGEREVEVDADDGEDESQGEPEVGDDGVERVGALDETAVVEDDPAL